MLVAPQVIVVLVKFFRMTVATWNCPLKLDRYQSVQQRGMRASVFLLVMLWLCPLVLSTRTGLVLVVSQLDAQKVPLSIFSTNAPIPKLTPVRSDVDVSCASGPGYYKHQRCFHFHNVIAESGQSETIATFEGWWDFDFSAYDPVFQVTCLAGCSIQQMSFGSDMVCSFRNSH